MIVGFSKYTGASSGKRSGSATRALEYFINPNRQGRENKPPVIVKGEPSETEELANSLTFEHKYTSGVLSFAPEDGNISPDIENDIIQRFESLAFAGLEPDQYDITWVRHTHAGHHELHFITPRVELNTGKSFNIRPPSKIVQQQYDDFRSEINAKYGFADPEDPARKRDLSIPDHILKTQKRTSEPKKDIREVLHSYLEQKALQGEIYDRESLKNTISSLGFEIPRAGKNYITVKDIENNKKFRMKGSIYEESFKPDRTLGSTDQARTRDYSRPDEDAFNRFKERVDRHIEERSRFNQTKYKIRDGYGHHSYSEPPKLNELASHGDTTGNDINHALWSQYLSRQPNTAQNEHADQDGTRTHSHSNEIMREKEETLHTNRRISTERKSLQSNSRILENDRTRKDAIESIRRFRKEISGSNRYESDFNQPMRTMFSTNEILGKIIGREKQIIQQNHELEKSQKQPHSKKRNFSPPR